MAPPPSHVALRLGALLGLFGVILGASGAHGPINVILLANGTLEIWKTAVLYQFVHALALLALSRGEVKKTVVWCWAIGVTFFSGSLYFLAVFPTQKWIGPITPLGGAFLIIGWGWLLWGACRPKTV